MSARECPRGATPAPGGQSARAAGSRERNGLVELPKPPRLMRGDRVQIVQGPFREHLALYVGQTSPERVAVLLQFLGGQHRTELPASAIEPLEVGQ
jgi:hypothetical protein